MSDPICVHVSMHSHHTMHTKINEFLGRIRTLEADRPPAHGATEVSTSREMCVQTTNYRISVVNESQNRFSCDQRIRKSRTHPATHFFASPSFQESSSCQLSESSCRCTWREKTHSDKALARQIKLQPSAEHVHESSSTYKQTLKKNRVHASSRIRKNKSICMHVCTYARMHRQTSASIHKHT